MSRAVAVRPATPDEYVTARSIVEGALLTLERGRLARSSTLVAVDGDRIVGALVLDGCEIDAVYGSPTADRATGRLMHVGTLFPSPKRDGETRGGIVLVRLDRVAASADLELVASWTERDGTDHSQRIRIELPDAPESYAHDGVRKAIALSRYARELRTWAETVHRTSDRSAAVDDWLLEDGRSKHERDSVPLAVPDDAAARFQRLRAYLADEMVALDDETLQQELNLLTRLCSGMEGELSKRPE